MDSARHVLAVMLADRGHELHFSRRLVVLGLEIGQNPALRVVGRLVQGPLRISGEGLGWSAFTGIPSELARTSSMTQTCNLLG